MTETIHISKLRVGDTILHDGKEKTVSANNIKKCPFMGISVFGDTYNLGYKPITRIIL